MKRIYFIVGLIALFASRLFFLSANSDFFDATQYLARVQDADFIHSLISGHPPFHPFYIVLGQIFYRFLKIFSLDDPGLALSLVSVVFGTASMMVYFQLVKTISQNQKLALWATLLASLIPFVWLAQITILIDSVNLFFTLLAGWMYWLGLNQKNLPKSLMLIFSAGLSFGLALFTHTQAGLWIIFFVALFIFWIIARKPRIKIFLQKLAQSFTFAIGPILAVAGYVYLMIYASPIRPDLEWGILGKKTALEHLLLDNIGDKATLNWGNFSQTVFPSFITQISWIGLFALITIIFILIKRKQNIFWLFFIWLAYPTIFIPLYHYMNLHGRAFLPGLLGISWLWAYLLIDKSKFARMVGAVLIVQLLFAGFSSVLKYQTLPPNQKMAKIQKQLEPNGLFISSNSSRTWHNYPGKVSALGDDFAGTVLEKAQKTLSENKPVFVHSNAIYHPWWMLDGHFQHIDFQNAPRENYQTLIANFFQNFQMDAETTTDNPREFILRARENQSIETRIEKFKQQLPQSPNLYLIKLNQPIANVKVSVKSQKTYFSPDRIDQYDFIKRLAGLKKSQIHNFSFTDRDGIAILPIDLDKNDIQIILETNPSQTRLIGFPLVGFIKPTNTAFYATDCAGNICQCDFSLEYTNTLDAPFIGGEVGFLKYNYRVAKTGSKAGFLSGGPYLSLEPGKYQAIFSLAAGENKQDIFVGNIDISKNAGAEVLVSQKLKQTDFTSPQKFQDFSLDFDLTEKTKDIEFRAYFIGNTTLMHKKIMLKKLP